MHCVLYINESQWLKLYIKFNTQNRIEVKKNNDKDENALFKLICIVQIAIYRKTMENLRHRINVQLVNNKTDYLKSTWKPIYISHKICDNNLVEMCIGLKLNKTSIHWNVHIRIG